METLNGQLNFTDFLTEYNAQLEAEPTAGEFDSYRKKCDYCGFNRKGGYKKSCYWEDCKTKKSMWMPDAWRIPKLCGSCKYSNMFVYQGDYKAPIEEPNIYCMHKQGSLNRHSAYPDKVVKHFGVGSWNRQHEYDTCDRWESK